MRPNPASEAHRLLAPRIAYLVGTRTNDGKPNLIPVSNVTSVSTDPQQVLLAVHKRWQTFDNLSATSGFTLSVPTVEQHKGVWKLGARYSRYDLFDRYAKIRAAGMNLIDNLEIPGPALADGLGWMSCRTVQRLDFGGDHGVFVGEVVHVEFSVEWFDEEGVPRTDLRPLMQVTGNIFSTANGMFEIPYGDQ